MKINLARHSYSTSIRSKERRYWLAVDRVSLVDYLKWRLYHFYDMRIPNKIPGWPKFEAYLRRRFGAEVLIGFMDDPEPSLADRLVSWQYRQDLRCHHLGSKGKAVCQVEIDYETWEAIQDA